jgi:hypothetical protein
MEIVEREATNSNLRDKSRICQHEDTPRLQNGMHRAYTIYHCVCKGGGALYVMLCSPVQEELRWLCVSHVFCSMPGGMPHIPKPCHRDCLSFTHSGKLTQVDKQRLTGVSKAPQLPNTVKVWL